MKNIIKAFAIIALVNFVALNAAEKRASQAEYLELSRITARTPEQQERYFELQEEVAPHQAEKDRALLRGQRIREHKALAAIKNRTAEQEARFQALDRSLQAGKEGLRKYLHPSVGK